MLQGAYEIRAKRIAYSLKMRRKDHEKNTAFYHRVHEEVG
jgi:hypothetical protein